ncbi:MAG: EamA family transporter RarD [Lentisphaeria bacterium]|nr:EamA family transporter RarD [Lentisphaeria bacterium]
MTSSNFKAGIFALISSCLIWGFQPIFWKQIKHIPSVSTLGYRIIFGAVFMVLFMTITKRWGELKNPVTCFKDLFSILLNSVLVGVNWLVFVWCIFNDKIIEFSLGHFISPLLIMGLGRLVFKEQFTRTQTFAFSMGVLAVIYQFIQFGSFPLASATVAIVFSAIILTKRKNKLAPAPSLTIDTLILCIPTAILMFYYQDESFWRPSTHDNIYLIIGGAVTVFPMVLYAFGSRTCGFKISGLIQYIGPTLAFLTGIFLYNEPFSVNLLITFAIVWTGLGAVLIQTLVKSKVKS